MFRAILPCTATGRPSPTCTSFRWEGPPGRTQIKFRLPRESGPPSASCHEGLPRRPCAVRRLSDSRRCRSGPAGAVAIAGPRSRGQRVAEAGHTSARRRISPPLAGLPSDDLLMREVSEDGWGGRRQDPLAVRPAPSTESFPRHVRGGEGRPDLGGFSPSRPPKVARPCTLGYGILFAFSRSSRKVSASCFCNSW